MIDPKAALPTFLRTGFQAPAKADPPKPAPQFPSDQDNHFGDKSRIVEETANTQPDEEFLE